MDAASDTNGKMMERRRILSFLLGGLAFAIGTPAYLAHAHPHLRFYLLQPMIFGVQSLPYVVAAALWLPWRSPQASRLGHVLAGILFLAAVLLYVPMLTGLWPTGGDMVGLAFFLIAIGTIASILVVTLVAFGVLWLRRG